MSTRSTTLMTAASRQLDEAAEFLGALSAVDLHKPCRDDSGDGAGDAVGTAAAHLVDGYRRLGRFVQSLRSSPEPAATAAPTAAGYGRAHGHGHGHQHPGAPETVSDLLAALVEVKAPIGLLAELTDQELDGVSAEGNRFADGKRTLEQAIDAMLAHQDAHLVALRRALV